MGLVYSGAKRTNFVIFTCLGVDPFNTTRKICSYPSTYDMSEVKTFYYWNDSKVSIFTKESFSLLRHNKISLYMPSLATGSKLVVLTDASLGTGFDFLDRQTIAGTIYLHHSFSISNNAVIAYLRKVFVFSEDLKPFFKLPYPLTTQDVTFLNGVSNKTLEVSAIPGVSNDISPNYNNAVAFHNNRYIGLYNTLETATPKYTSSKESLFECVFLSGVQFSLSLNGPWSNVLNVPDIPPGGAVTVHARYGKVITVQEKMLQTIRVISTEEI